MNYFQLFNLPEKFLIDQKLLVKNFYDLQKKFHPDLFILDTPLIQQKALKQSILINNAFQTLKNPYHRAEYLLNLNNIDLNDKKFKLNDNNFFKKYLNLCENFNKIKLMSLSKNKLIIFNKNIIMIKIKQYNEKIAIELENKKWLYANYTIQKIYYFIKLQKNIEKEIRANNIY
ncbi:Co-chaperone protein HscB [Buchnera aphidicola (Eriosoma grossulariae)]|uniref:Fe-S protein assembly co-chaperone HscB n=1 Tax=Buchnera aphidicola TaxID=9 RepID=UPI003463FD14